MTAHRRLAAKAYNERLKLITSIMSNGGLALIGAASGLMYGKDKVEPPLLFWLLSGGVLIVASIAHLSSLRSEE